MKWFKKKEEQPLVVHVQMPDRQVGTCDTCIYWGDILDNGGACHFNPPPFPQTRKGQWCGRWASSE